MTKLVHGFGVNDIDGPTEYLVNGKRVRYKDYASWVGMIARCEYQDHIAYSDKSICQEWKYFSNFKLWFDEQVYYEGLQLDKDILFVNNKIYSPHSCAFVPSWVNTVLGNGGSKEDRKISLGVSKRNERYRAQVSEFLTGKRAWLGSFNSQEEAHTAWQEGKISQIEACVKRYREEKCYREDVEKGLTFRIDKLKFDLQAGLETVRL